MDAFILWHQFRNTPLLPQNFKGQSSICFLFIITILQAKSSTPGCTVVWAHQHLDTYTAAAQCLEMWHSFSFHLAFRRWWDRIHKLIKCFLVFLWTSKNEDFFSSSGFGFHNNFTHDTNLFIIRNRKETSGQDLSDNVCQEIPPFLHCTTWGWRSLWNLLTLPLLHKKNPCWFQLQKKAIF